MNNSDWRAATCKETGKFLQEEVGTDFNKGGYVKENTRYSGEHKGIKYEIQRFPAFEYMNCKYSWCHYIYVYDTQLSEKPELPKPYFTAWGTLLTECPNWVHKIDFHGGCTYYEIEKTNHLGNILKIGCDYQHYWDEGNSYTLDYVQSETIKSVESLLSLFPDLKTAEQISKEFRSKFPGEKHKGGIGRFDVNGNEISTDL